MTESELTNYIGHKVFVYFKNGERGIYGTLKYADILFEGIGHLTRYFYIGNSFFPASSIRNIEEREV